MKSVGIRHAQKHLTTLLKELPFAITRYGKIVARVIKPIPDASFQRKAVPPVVPPTISPTAPSVMLCKHGNVKALCKQCL